MKSVLLSIQPKWCKLIFSGEKTIEWCEKSRNTDDNLEMCCNCKNAFFDEDGAFFGCGVTRPPQSWMYVEELC